MKKFLAILLCVLFASMIFAQEAAPSIAISGNVYTGLKMDISESAKTIYAWEDANGTPIWANLRFDYSLDKNAGATINLRIKSTDAISSTSSRAYPFMNRGFIWAKLADGLFKIRSGYLWDSDFESSNNGWDTASNYEWVTELTAYPIPTLELGATIPTPYNKMDLGDSIKDITYGIVYSPTNFRFSAMGQYGSTDAMRSMNFGADFTGIKNMLIRCEGDLQQIGISDLGYYQLFQQINYTFGKVTPDLQVTEVLSKVSGVSPTLKFVPNVTAVVNGITLYAQVIYSFATETPDQSYKQAKVSAVMPINAKCNMKPFAYVTQTLPGTEIVFSPGVQFFASF